MSWASAIPLVTLLAVVFAAGALVAQVRAVREAVGELKADMKQSAKDQGTRIGNIEDRVKVLEDFRARTETIQDMSGRVRT